MVHGIATAYVQLHFTQCPPTIKDWAFLFPILKLTTIIFWFFKKANELIRIFHYILCNLQNICLLACTHKKGMLSKL